MAQSARPTSDGMVVSLPLVQPEGHYQTFIRGRASTATSINTMTSNIGTKRSSSYYVRRQVIRMVQETNTTEDHTHHTTIANLFRDIVAHSFESQLDDHNKNNSEHVDSTNERSTEGNNFEPSENNNITTMTTIAPTTAPDNGTYYQHDHEGGSMRFGLLFLGNLLTGIVLMIIVIRAVEYLRYKCCGSSFFATVRQLDMSRHNSSDQHPDAPPPGPRVELDHGPIVAKAGLVGITLEERAQVLPEIFHATTFVYNSSIPLYQQVPIYNIHAPLACPTIHKIEAIPSSSTPTTDSKSCDDLESILLTCPTHGGETVIDYDDEKGDSAETNSAQGSFNYTQQQLSTPEEPKTDETNEDVVVPHTTENGNETPELESAMEERRSDLSPDTATLTDVIITEMCHTDSITEQPFVSESTLETSPSTSATPELDTTIRIILAPVDDDGDDQLERSNTANDVVVDDDITVDEMENDYFVKCPICLDKLKEGDIVMSGTQCIHVFHKQCCLEWLYKNDHCPNCRNEMFDPQEMVKGTIRVLGEDRVRQLNRGNFCFSQLP